MMNALWSYHLANGYVVVMQERCSSCKPSMLLFGKRVNELEDQIGVFRAEARADREALVEFKALTMYAMEFIAMLIVLVSLYVGMMAFK